MTPTDILPRPTRSTARPSNSLPSSSFLALRPSDLVHLVGFHHGVRLRYRVSSRRLVIERAAVFVRVSMQRTERVPASALETRQPYPLLARKAPVSLWPARVPT